ncbi:hypothetical protein MRS76_01585 [Rhizobiaceae bacterium n13]|uniref:Transmembrane protein n=1 Tax=Ferirhizobium litorale TaxID=2927786 RepID=A0AAE3QB77_9HYPH|nr:hypothetical protein [Fererhizobium litorale]MDI7860635.1 hypothetical protein [Fererhizobium litorale]MDI7920783.1 hypothetical protein [Fererhizobium litorale]
MANIEPDDQEEEKPLDPVMEKVRRKMVRLQLVSAGVMFVSLMAVLGAVVYKVTKSETKETTPLASLAVPSDGPIAATAALPAGFAVSDVSLSGAQILFYGRTVEGQQKAYVFDVSAGRIVADVAVGSD